VLRCRNKIKKKKKEASPGEEKDTENPKNDTSPTQVSSGKGKGGKRAQGGAGEKGGKKKRKRAGDSWNLFRPKKKEGKELFRREREGMGGKSQTASGT